MSGVGGVIVPVITGQLMGIFGPESLLVILCTIFCTIVIYGIYRSTKRSIIDIDSSTTHVAIMPQATNVAVEISQEAANAESANSND